MGQGGLSGLSGDEFYARLMRADGRTSDDLPRWPDPTIQARYVGSSGSVLIERSRDFVAMLAADGAFRPGWKGLDYGAGFGRLASVLLERGAPEQLDLVDAWEGALALLRTNGFRNSIRKISDILRPGELPVGAYDFVYSFSIWTHLAEAPFWSNLTTVLPSLRPGGRFYVTVRHREFLPSPQIKDQAGMRAALDATGFAYQIAMPGTPTAEIFGDSIIDEATFVQGCAARGAKAKYLGRVPGQFQQLYAVEPAPAA